MLSRDHSLGVGQQISAMDEEIQALVIPGGLIGVSAGNESSGRNVATPYGGSRQFLLLH